MPVGSSAQAAAISRPRTAAKVIAASAVSTPASAAAPSSPTLWPATTRDVVQRQVLGGEQRGRDQQRLGPGGVPDLVGVGVGAQVDQVDPGQRRPPAQPRLGAGEVEPRGRGSRASESPGRERVRRARLRLSRIPAGYARVALDQTLRRPFGGFLQRSVCVDPRSAARSPGPLARSVSAQVRSGSASGEPGPGGRPSARSAARTRPAADSGEKPVTSPTRRSR